MDQHLLSMVQASPPSGIGALHTQDRIGTRHQSRHRDEIAAVPAAAKIALVRLSQDVLHALPSHPRASDLRLGHLLRLHRVDSTQAPLLSLVELHGLGRTREI